MTEYRRQVLTVLEAVRIHATNTFSLLGRRTPPLPARIRTAMSPAVRRAYLLHTLQHTLYSDFYSQGELMPAPARWSPALGGRTPFVETLSAANAGTGFLDGGWELQEVHGETALLRRPGLSVMAPVADFVREGPEGAVRLRLPPELLAASPGFYVAVGDADDRPTEGLVRLYFNATAAVAAPLTQHITRYLNARNLPFRFKIVNDPAAFTRCDAAVLYLDRAHAAHLEPLLRALPADVQASLGRNVPAFTKRIGTGIGLAEDSGGAESFGQHRCRLLAEAILLAHDERIRDRGARLDVVGRRFAQEGIDLDAPYLSSGSRDRYGFFIRSPAAGTEFSPAGLDVSRRSASPMQMADRVAQRLVDEAIWDGPHCNWLGEPADRISKGGMPILGALPPHLYAGTAGVALFLAHYHAATGNMHARAAALGAIHNALTQTRSIPLEERAGLYGGATGVAWTAATVARLLDEAALVDAAVELAHRTLEPSYPPAFDLVSGRAGGILALLFLHAVAGDQALLRGARRWGDELIAQGRAMDGTLSWFPPGPHPGRAWTGYSHGAAGAGHALLELWFVSRLDRYLAAAEAAFAYERLWFNPETRNWPDFRDAHGRKHHLPCASWWCHGSAGIALSRLRAHELTGRTVYLTEAEIGAEATLRQVEADLRTPHANVSLCHGLMGNSLVLLDVMAALGRRHEAETIARTVEDLAQSGAETRHWPCGTPQGGDTPALMLGTAGVGLFFLRRADAGVPHPLLIRPGGS